MVVQVDETDPLVVVLTWGLTWAAGRCCHRVSPRLRQALPLVAVGIAVLLRALIDLSEGEPPTPDTLLRALAAAAAAVFAHSQAREGAKLWRSTQQPTAGPTAAPHAPTDTEAQE